MNKKVSIIVPVYNCEKYIGKCLQSIVDQTYDNIEIIVVNDGSTDQSTEICNIFAEKYTNLIVIHQQNMGLGAARNIGVSRATGDYITYVDSDDYISDHCIEKTVNIAEQYNVELVEFGKIFMLASKNIFINCNQTIEYFDTKEKILAARSTMKDTAWGRLYKRELALKVRFPEVRLYEDVAYAKNIFINCHNMVKYNYCLYAYRAYQESLTRGKAAFKTIKRKIREYEEQGYSSGDIEKEIEKGKEFIAYCRKVTEDIIYRGEQIISVKQLKEIHSALKNIKEKNYSDTVKSSFETELDTAIEIVNKAIQESQASIVKRFYKQMRNYYGRCLGRIKTLINYEYRI